MQSGHGALCEPDTTVADLAADGFPAEFAELIGEMRGIEFVPIEFGVADDLEP